jgi:N6-adenosine-specific RNA methylase IME4
MVERVSPAPRLEIFARRARFGWDYAGDGSLGTVEIPGLRSPGLQEAA